MVWPRICLASMWQPHDTTLLGRCGWNKWTVEIMDGGIQRKSFNPHSIQRAENERPDAIYEVCPARSFWGGPIFETIHRFMRVQFRGGRAKKRAGAVHHRSVLCASQRRRIKLQRSPEMGQDKLR